MPFTRTHPKTGVFSLPFCTLTLTLTLTAPNLQGGRVEVGAPTGRWQMVVVYRGKHDPLCLTYLAALQHLMPEFEEMNVDVVAVSADTRNRACAFVSRCCGTV